MFLPHLYRFPQAVFRSLAVAPKPG